MTAFTDMPLDAWVIRIFAYGLLLHQGANLSGRGAGYLRRCFVPNLGLRLSPVVHTAVHAALVLAAGALFIAPATRVLYPVLLVLLTLVVSSYSIRLSNHLMFAWFVALLLTIAAWLPVTHDSLMLSPVLVRGLQGLVVMTYWISFLHKLNADFLSTRRSWAMRLATVICHYLRVTRGPAIIAVGQMTIVATLVFEAGIPVLLLFPQTTSIGILVGVAFHAGLATVGVMHFSTIMYAGLLAFVPPDAFREIARAAVSGGPRPWMVYAVLGLAALVLALPSSGSRRRWLARGLTVTFAVLTLALMAGATRLLAAAADTSPGLWTGAGPLETVVVVLVWILFLVNGLGPYLGLKTEYSLAMFSNLRSDPWTHLLFPGDWRPFRLDRYVEIRHIEGLPPRDALHADVAAQTAHDLLSAHAHYRYSAYCFSESLRSLCGALPETHAIRVRYIDADKRSEADQETEFVASRASVAGIRAPRVNLFPLVMPLDPEAHHSELSSYPIRRYYNPVDVPS